MIRAIDRYLELDRMEKHRKAQVQQQDRERAAKPMSVVAAAEADANAGGGTPGGSVSTPATTTRKPLPLIAFPDWWVREWKILPR